MTTREFLQKQGLAKAYDICEEVASAYTQKHMLGSQEGLNVLDERIGSLKECVEVLTDLGVSPEGIEELQKLLPLPLADRLTFLDPSTSLLPK